MLGIDSLYRFVPGYKRKEFFQQAFDLSSMYADASHDYSQLSTVMQVALLLLLQGSF